MTRESVRCGSRPSMNDGFTVIVEDAKQEGGFERYESSLQFVVNVINNNQRRETRLLLVLDQLVHLHTQHRYLESVMQDQGRPGPSQASTSMTPSQAAVPLHLALTWLAVKALPSAHGPGVSEQVYSSTFVAAILEVISIQVLEASIFLRPDPVP